MWTLKHRPADLSGFLGKTAADNARKWDGKNLIVYGGIGVGKSLLVELMAKEHGYDIYAVDDSNLQGALDAANTVGLFGGKKMIVVEDAESIRDIKTLSNLIELSKSPVVVVTSDYSNRRLTTIKKKLSPLQVKRALPASIAKYLRGICESEGVDADDEAVKVIAKNAQGDIRAAISDLETLACGKNRLTTDSIEELSLERDRKSDIYRALSIIFGSRDVKKSLASTWDISEQPRDVLWWVDENLPKLYREKQSLKMGLDNLSRADVFLGRIMRRQYWGFLRYSNAMMTVGVTVARPKKINFTRYTFPSYFANMGRTKSQRNIRDMIAYKMALSHHVSKKVFINQYIPFYKKMIKKGVFDLESLEQKYRLSPDEAEHLGA